MSDPAAEHSQDSELDLSRYLAILLRRWQVVAALFIITVISTGLKVFTDRPVFTATTLVLIEKEEKGAQGEASLGESRADDYYQTQYKLLKSRSLIKKVYELLDLSSVPEFSGPSGVDKLIRAVTVAPVLRSRLVNVSAESFDPELAARLSNKLCEVHVSQNIENKLFISKEILASLYGKGGNLSSLAGLPAVVNNSLIQTLKGNYATLEARWGDLSGRYTPEHPERMRLKSEMAALKGRIDEETRRVIEGVKAELSGQMLGNNIRIVDPAEVPRSPSKPKKARALAIAAALGLLAGFLLALGLDSLDQTIHSQEDVERKLGLPFLGSVPRSEALSAATAEEYHKLLTGPQSLTAESFKNIRTMLGFSAAGKEMKAILLTSAAQGEGKTFLSINLAMVFAQLGEKVLLIEGDLRRPNLHKRFGLSKENGLSTFLAHGQEVSEIAAFIQDTPLPNLKVLVCGPIPPNPSELLSTPRLKALLIWAKGRYDRVIIDGTPIFPITDALLWGHETDAAVFVVQFGGINVNLAVRARQKLEESGLKIAGAVVNQVVWKTGTYGDYYYQYKYYSHDETPA